MNKAKLILASASPRRLELLKQIGIAVDQVVPADLDETPLKNELPTALAARLAKAKCNLIADKFPNDFVLAADTVVALGRRQLGKAENAAEAEKFIQLLSGRRHRVITAVAIRYANKKSSRVISTVVAFKKLTHQEIKDYIATNEWQGVAGAYRIQGMAERFVKFINGSYSNVVGLPLYETTQMLKGMGYHD